MRKKGLEEKREREESEGGARELWEKEGNHWWGENERRRGRK